MTIKTAETEVLDAAAEVVDRPFVVKVADVKGTVAHDAETLDREIRAGFAVVLESQSRLVTLVKEAKESQIHKLLDDPATGKAYKSWTAYMGDVIKSIDVDLKAMSARDKTFLIVTLYNTGMSQKVIAAALAVGVATVNRAVQAGRLDGAVDKDRATESRDGRTFEDTENGGAVAKPKMTKTRSERAAGYVGLLAKIADEMDAGELSDLKVMLSTLGKQINARVKATSK